jgi:heterodisulfide reductase subunit B2
MKHALFLGCFIPVRLPHLEAVARRVLPKLGIELTDIEEFTCCPEPVGFLTDKLTGLAIAARNICLAEEAGLDIITLCNGCTYTLRQANETLKSDQYLRTKVNSILSGMGHEFRGTVDVRHFAQILAQRVGFGGIRSAVKKPLAGLRVACHPGCHILSPPGVMGFDDPINPMVLDSMVTSLGAEPVDWDIKTRCCGWTLTNYGNRESANRLLGAKLEAMHAARADCSVVICPQCFYQFDTGQMLAARDLKLDYRIPTIYYLQLLAMAMGYSLDEAGIKQNRVKDPGLDDKLGRLTA